MRIPLLRLLTTCDERRAYPRLLTCASLVLFLGAGPVNSLVDSASINRPAGFVAIAPGKLDFGFQSVGEPSQPKTATLTNTGPRMLVIRDVTVSGIDFTETDTCQGSLAPGASCTIAVTFKPAITGPRLGAIIITDSDVASPHMLVLSGEGQ